MHAAYLRLAPCTTLHALSIYRLCQNVSFGKASDDEISKSCRTLLRFIARIQMKSGGGVLCMSALQAVAALCLLGIYEAFKVFV